MHVDVYTGALVRKRDALTRDVERTLRSLLGPLEKRILHLEVHLADEGGADLGKARKRCGREKMLNGSPPLPRSPFRTEWMTLEAEGDPTRAGFSV